MRVPIGLFALTIALPATGAVAASPQDSHSNGLGTASAQHCPRTTGYQAVRDLYRGHKLAPKKLTELPPGTAYMAVYRVIAGCEVPLTMADYRNPRRR
jgi:hypothetical protein